MVAQEIIHRIKKPNIDSNVIIKLDMEKAYDRVSWSYTCLVLRKMGFAEILIIWYGESWLTIHFQSLSMVRDMASFIPLEVSSKVILFLRAYLF